MMVSVYLLGLLYNIYLGQQGHSPTMSGAVLVWRERWLLMIPPSPSPGEDNLLRHRTVA